MFLLFRRNIYAYEKRVEILSLKEFDKPEYSKLQDLGNKCTQFCAKINAAKIAECEVACVKFMTDPKAFFAELENRISPVEIPGTGPDVE